MLIACPNCATASPSLDAPVLEPGRCAFCGSIRLSASTPEAHEVAAPQAFGDSVAESECVEAAEPVSDPVTAIQETDATPDESPAKKHAVDIERDLLRKLAEVLEPAYPCRPADAPEPIADAVLSAPDIAPEPLAEAASSAADIAPEPIADADSSASDEAPEPRAEASDLDVVPERTEATARAPTMPPVERMEPTTRSIRPPQKSSRRRDIASYVARRQRLHAARQPFRLPRIGLPAAILALVAAASTLVAGRSEIVRHAPQTASLYAALGMPVNLRALDFDNVTTARENHDGVNVLVVEGNIVSSAAKSVDVPQLRFAIRNPDGLEIYSWTAPPERSMLAPGEQMAFRSRLAAPPTESNEVMVRFVGRQDEIAGLQ